MNGGVERVNDTMAQMLAMVVNERQDDLRHSSAPCGIRLRTTTYSVSAATGLAPNEVHMMNRLPRLPMTVFEQQYARGR